MIDFRAIDELTRRLTDALPPGLAQRKEEVDAQFRSVLTAAFERMNLVGREEFDEQRAVLAQTREKIEALEARLRKLQQES